MLARGGARRIEGARRDVEDWGAGALVVLTDVADADASRARPTRLSGSSAHRIWVTTRWCRSSAREGERPEEYRRVTEVTYLGYSTARSPPEANAAARPRRVVQVGSALATAASLCSRLLRREARRAGLHDSLRSELSSRQSNVRVTMVATARDEHAAVQLGPSRLPTGLSPCPRSTSPKWGPRRFSSPRAATGGRDVRRLPDRRGDCRRQIAPGFADWYLAKNGYRRSRRPNP